MPDPEMVSEAQRAALVLERAWERWRIMHGLSAAPTPPVSSYVGYSIEEPWGRPRVVFGIDAPEAEMLAALLDSHQCVGPFFQPEPGLGARRRTASQREQRAASAAPAESPPSGLAAAVPEPAGPGPAVPGPAGPGSAVPQPAGPGPAAPQPAGPGPAAPQLARPALAVPKPTAPSPPQSWSAGRPSAGANRERDAGLPDLRDRIPAPAPSVEEQSGPSSAAEPDPAACHAGVAAGHPGRAAGHSGPAVAGQSRPVPGQPGPAAVPGSEPTGTAAAYQSAPPGVPAGLPDGPGRPAGANEAGNGAGGYPVPAGAGPAEPHAPAVHTATSMVTNAWAGAARAGESESRPATPVAQATEVAADRRLRPEEPGRHAAGPNAGRPASAAPSSPPRADAAAASVARTVAAGVVGTAAGFPARAPGHLAAWAGPGGDAGSRAQAF